jgi:hypothetical protein
MQSQTCFSVIQLVKSTDGNCAYDHSLAAPLPVEKGHLSMRTKAAGQDVTVQVQSSKKIVTLQDASAASASVERKKCKH